MPQALQGIDQRGAAQGWQLAGFRNRLGQDGNGSSVVAAVLSLKKIDAAGLQIECCANDQEFARSR